MLILEQCRVLLPSYFLATPQLSSFSRLSKGSKSTYKKLSRLFWNAFSGDLNWFGPLPWNRLRSSLSLSGHTAFRKAGGTGGQNKFPLSCTITERQVKLPSWNPQYSPSQIHPEMAFYCHVCSFCHLGLSVLCVVRYRFGIQCLIEFSLSFIYLKPKNHGK